MATRDRSLLGVGDPRPPEAPEAASRVAAHVARDRDDEVRLFRTVHLGLRELAVVAGGDKQRFVAGGDKRGIEPDELVVEALARCLARRPLAAWDDVDLERAVVVVATERAGGMGDEPGRRRLRSERAVAAHLARHDGRSIREVARVLECSTATACALVLTGPRRPAAPVADDDRWRPRHAPDAAAVLEAAHERVRSGRVIGAPVRGAGLPHVVGAVLLAAALGAFAVLVTVAGAAVSPTNRPEIATPEAAAGVVRRAPVPHHGGQAIARPYDQPWWPYELAFSTIRGIEVPVGAWVDHRPEHHRTALLGDVYPIAATPDGPIIGYHHQLFGYLPAAIVDQPGFEWARWVAEHNGCAPDCISLPTSG